MYGNTMEKKQPTTDMLALTKKNALMIRVNAPFHPPLPPTEDGRQGRKSKQNGNNRLEFFI